CWLMVQSRSRGAPPIWIWRPAAVVVISLEKTPPTELMSHPFRPARREHFPARVGDLCKVGALGPWLRLGRSQKRQAHRRTEVTRGGPTPSSACREAPQILLHPSCSLEARCPRSTFARW